MKKFVAVLAVPATLLAAAATTADAAPSRSGATLAVTAEGQTVAAGSGYGTGSSLVFGGCGYAPGVGVTVTVQTPSALSFFGAKADGNGCFSTAETQDFTVYEAGSYTAKAWQSSKRRADASVSFTVSN